MARAGKGDLADYGQNIGQTKKEKSTIPGFDDVADNNKINEQQEIKEQNEQPEVPVDPPVKEEQENEQEPEHIPDEFTEQFLEQFNKKVTKEDTHTRQTWLIKNETIKRLDKLSKGKRKGFKTELVNQALEMFLNRIEK